jgi:hypothetical protein
MRTKTISTTLISISLVFFMASTGISNPAKKYTGDILKKIEHKINSADKGKVTVSFADADNDFSYLRFDVNEYIAKNTPEELPVNSFDYLRFDVNNYADANASEIIELPSNNEFESLRFDVNNFVESNNADLDEMPVNEFDYLRFDVENFISTGNSDELPLTE